MLRNPPPAPFGRAANRNLRVQSPGIVVTFVTSLAAESHAPFVALPVAVNESVYAEPDPFSSCGGGTVSGGAGVGAGDDDFFLLAACAVNVRDSVDEGGRSACAAAAR